MSELVLKRCGAERIDECIEVFRGSLIWERYFSEDDRLRRYYRLLGRTYNQCRELRCGEFEYSAPDGDVFICRRIYGTASCTAAVNRSPEEKTINVTGTDLLTGQQCRGELKLPPLGGALVRMEIN